MIIKRYIVDNMNEAMIKIRYELGNDAVIVSQRKIRQKGIWGIFKRKKIEVTAAVDEKNKSFKKAQNNEDIQKEISELKDMVENLTKNSIEKEKKRETITKSKNKLFNCDIPEDIVNEIDKRIKDKNGDKRLSPKLYKEEMIKVIQDLICVTNLIEGRVQVFIGPTGVGKTTTIAKLASNYTLYKNKKVGLVTLDTYRIGAVEQLKAYADILNIPFGVIISPKDIPVVLEKMIDRDIILVDTMGRNSKNMMQLSEIRNYIDELKADGIHLVVSMTTKNSDLKEIIDNYSKLKYNSIILTKVDETDSFGSILSSMYYSKVPVSYITIGQNVPEDIEKADKEKFINLIMGAED